MPNQGAKSSLVSSFSMYESEQRFGVDPTREHYQAMVLTASMYATLPTVTDFFQRLPDKASALPGVESAALIGAIPSRCCVEQYSFSIVGHAMPPPEYRPQAGFSEAARAGLFDTLKIPLLKGRYLDDHDTTGAPWVIVVNVKGKGAASPELQSRGDGGGVKTIRQTAWDGEAVRQTAWRGV